MPLRVYLSGAIEHAADHGKGWRAKVERFLNELGHKAYDPARDEKKDLTEEELSSFRDWKQTDPARFRSVIRKIIYFVTGRRFMVRTTSKLFPRSASDWMSPLPTNASSAGAPPRNHFASNSRT